MFPLAKTGDSLIESRLLAVAVLFQTRVRWSSEQLCALNSETIYLLWSGSFITIFRTETIVFKNRYFNQLSNNNDNSNSIDMTISTQIWENITSLFTTTTDKKEYNNTTKMRLIFFFNHSSIIQDNYSKVAVNLPSGILSIQSSHPLSSQRLPLIKPAKK